jgi:TonB family protein
MNARAQCQEQAPGLPSRRKLRGLGKRTRIRNPILHLAASAVAVFVVTALPAAWAAEPPKAFAFMGAPYIITAEVAGPHTFVLNFFNLSEYVIVVQPNEFIYKGSSGQFYIGQVFDLPTKTTRGTSYRYSASFLLNGNSFKGLNVLGAFHELDRIEEVSVRIGARRFYMMPIDRSQYDQLGTKVGDLDMKNPDPQTALRMAGITDLGRVTTTDGTSEWDRDWQDLLLSDGVNPPRILESPEVLPTDEARRTSTYGKVRLSATITRDGAILSVSVVKGLGRGLDERARETVKASWVFLPATKNGEVVETDVKFDVSFEPPKK